MKNITNGQYHSLLLIVFNIILVTVFGQSLYSAPYEESVDRTNRSSATILDYALVCNVCSGAFGGPGAKGFAFRNDIVSGIKPGKGGYIQFEGKRVYTSNVLLDSKNGFFTASVADAPDDSFPETLTMALFLKKDRTKVVAITYDQSGLGSDSYDYKFYRIQSDKWIDVTKDVLSLISLSDFTQDAEAMKELEALVNWQLVLPRFGTTAILRANGYYDYNEAQSRLFMTQIGKGASMELLWDPVSGKFKKGKIIKQL